MPFRPPQTAPPPHPVAEPALRGLTGALVGTRSESEDGAEHPRPVAEHPRPVAEDPPAPAEATRTAVTGGQGWTDEQDDELREGVDIGLSVDELADHLDLPAGAVAARLGQLGLAAPAGDAGLFD